MVEIECLVCRQTIEIPQSIDTDNYDGQVACRECASLLHVKLVASKVRKYEVVEKGSRHRTADNLSDDKPSTITKRRRAPKSGKQVKKEAHEKANIENIAKYNLLRDYLAGYRATRLQLAFEQIESIIGCELETGAYTFKSWWENDRNQAQAFAWLEAGWQIHDVDLAQRRVIFRHESGI